MDGQGPLPLDLTGSECNSDSLPSSNPNFLPIQYSHQKVELELELHLNPVSLSHKVTHEIVEELLFHLLWHCGRPNPQPLGQSNLNKSSSTT